MIEQTQTFTKDTFQFDLHYQSPEGEVTRLLFVFPGADYSYLGPFLYYPTQRVLKWQTAVLMADYDFTTWAETMTLSQGEAMAFAVAETVTYALAKHPNVQEFLFLGKSLGAEALLEAEYILEQRQHPVKSAKFVFLTPVWNNNDIVTDMGSLPYESLYVIGDKDPYYSEKVLEYLKKQGKSKILVIPGANHDLEIEDEFDTSVAAQQQILDAIVEFQKRPKPAVAGGAGATDAEGSKRGAGGAKHGSGDAKHGSGDAKSKSSAAARGGAPGGAAKAGGGAKPGGKPGSAGKTTPTTMDEDGYDDEHDDFDDED